MGPQTRNPKEHFKVFCEQTSLHGWNFLAYSKFKCIHVTFWLSVIIGAAFVCTFCIYQNTEEFIEATVDFQTAYPAYLINANAVKTDTKNNPAMMMITEQPKRIPEKVTLVS